VNALTSHAPDGARATMGRAQDLEPKLRPVSRGFVLRGLIVITLLTFSLTRLAGLAADASLHSLQMDYAAFQTAGQASNAGLSPYRNHVDREPPIWDGVNEYTHSRFLYPPLVATLMQPLALLPYSLSKILWTTISLICIMTAVVLSARHLKLPTWQTLLVIGLVGLFHPLLTEIERGQIDGIILLLITCAIIALDRARTPSQLLAGGLLAIATLLKLHCVFFLPFLLLRKKRHAVLGFMGGAVMLLAASLLLNGPEQIRSYLFEELPRIARHGEGGDSTMKLHSQRLDAMRATVPADSAIKDRRLYGKELFAFRTNASFVRVANFVLYKAGIHTITATMTSAIVLCSLILILWIYHRRFLVAGSLPTTSDFLYWQIVLVVILMAGPMTWSMNLVWLVVTIVVAVNGVHGIVSSQRRADGETYSVYLLVLGLAVAAMPDDRSFPMWLPLASPLFVAKYIAAELLVFAGLLGYTKYVGLNGSSQPDAEPNAGTLSPRTVGP